jgi:methylmalonyl-CoA mutase N-terminal domain/subunit
VLEEVAKFRAARRIYSRVMDERFGAEKPESKRLKFHTQTAGQSLTAQQPLNNIIRVTLQAAAAVMGGTQSLHTNSYDEALALPSEEAVRIALRTQQIIADESGLADTVDPLGGSYAVETLTDEMEAEAMAYIEEIEEMGDGSILEGIFTGIQEGYFHREIQDSAFEYQRRVDDGEEVVVGVNRYANEEGEEEDIDLLHVSDEVRERQLERLERVKDERDDEEVEATLDALREAIETGENTMPYVVDAVKAYATMGEIMQVFEAEHGSYTETVGLA